MFENLFYIVLALLGISFLVFIHELGHYWMARKVGITVEIFAIGFGKALYEWEHRGVKWRIGWLPFGGYVKMAGMEKKGSIEPHQIPDGFFGARPWNRIKVAFWGPLANILFAFAAFTLLWALGGRMKPFQDFTSYIGWVDRESSLYQDGIRPGDQIQTFNGRAFHGFEDLVYGSMLDNQVPVLSGQEIDYFQGSTTPFTYTFHSEAALKSQERTAAIFRSISPANYLLFDRLSDGSPLSATTLQKGERFVWIDGELIFSARQLAEVLNDSKVLLTIEREGSTFLTRVPRLKISDLRLAPHELGEFDDWRFEAALTPKAQDLYFIPYNLNPQAVVEAPFSYVDQNSKVQPSFQTSPRSFIEQPLQAGDKILAVDGQPIDSSYALLSQLQTRNIQIIVQKEAEKVTSWKDADAQFADSIDLQALKQIVQSIGTGSQVQQAGSLRLLESVRPISVQDVPLSEKDKRSNQKKQAEQRKQIESIKDPAAREEALKQLEVYQNRLVLGVRLSDRQVRFNPEPFTLFSSVVMQTGRTLHALVTGFLSPKNLMGPVGIVQTIQSGWEQGFKDALFWLGMISLNLALFNLLPIPVLDGGYILFAAIEAVTKKPLSSRTREMLFFLFFILLIALFVYITFYDVSRLIR